MKPKLTPKMSDVLKEVIHEHCPDLFSNIESFKIKDLTPEQISQLCETITDEFCATGLKSDSEPNERGILLEELLDYVKNFQN